MKNAIFGFIACYTILITVACVAMYNGYLIDKTKLQVTVCTAIQQAVADYADDNAAADALDARVKPVKIKE